MSGEEERGTLEGKTRISHRVDDFSQGVQLCQLKFSFSQPRHSKKDQL